MPTPISPSAAQAARELRTSFSRLRRRLREVVELDSLTPTQTAVLSRLAKDGETTASALADAERVRPQSMAATLSVLDQRGLLQRRPDPDDGRRLLLSLALAGRELVDDSRRTREEWLARTLQDRLSEAERTTLLASIALLERITES